MLIHIIRKWTITPKYTFVGLLSLRLSIFKHCLQELVGQRTLDFLSFYELCCPCLLDFEDFCVDERGAFVSMRMAECMRTVYLTLMLLYLVLLCTAHTAHSIYPRIRLSHKGKKYRACVSFITFNLLCQHIMVLHKFKCSVVLQQYEGKDSLWVLQHSVLNCLE